MYFKTAGDIWQDLDDRFGQPIGTQLFSLQQELAKMEQGHSNVSECFTKLKVVWDEIDNLEPLQFMCVLATTALVT